ncbi:MAG: type II toxin-antitoxin system RelE/ParE family toxin [bacterium]
MRYDYEFSSDAARYLRRLETRRQIQISQLLDQLRTNPLDPLISRPLSGKWEGAGRSRIGNLRLIYEVIDERLLVYVIRLGPRGDIY